MRIRYNAPFTLTFSLVCALVLALDQFAIPHLIQNYFTVGGQGSFQAGDPLSWLRLVSYTVGHSDWNHFLGNLSFILLLGPILEEKYQTPTVMIMAAIAAVATGLVNTFFFSTALLGASGIVFLFIILASFTNIRAGEIPLTFVGVIVLYLGKEVMDAFKNDNVSQFAHIVGGALGSLFGFWATRFQDSPGKSVR
jgi:membrane associated rhomboid family serine protease